MSQRPLIAITMGDPAGVGAEVTVKAMNDATLYERCRPLVVGDRRRLELAAAACGLAPAFHAVESPAAGRYQHGTIDVLDLANVPADLPWGQLDARAGAAAFAYIERAIKLAMDKQVDAVCTAPLNKEALHKAGYKYPGHTEIFGELTGSKEYAMLLLGGPLRVIHVTVHQGLQSACQRIAAHPERVVTVIRLADQACRQLGVANPRIAVAGLNPHAGEGGIFGDEEAKSIIPACEEARQQGLQVFGPLPGDTVFLRAKQGHFDIVVAQYHDQGHIPIKMLGFETGVNITYGLPIIRTSVDHGTAFDIAGKGIADHRSMIEAIDMACLFARGGR